MDLAHLHLHLGHICAVRRCVLPIAALFSGTLWMGNAAYLYLSVAFIQMIKASVITQSWAQEILPLLLSCCLSPCPLPLLLEDLSTLICLVASIMHDAGSDACCSVYCRLRHGHRKV